LRVPFNEPLGCCKLYNAVLVVIIQAMCSVAVGLLTMGKNCQQYEMSSQFSRDGGIQFCIIAMLIFSVGASCNHDAREMIVRCVSGA